METVTKRKLCRWLLWPSLVFSVACLLFLLLGRLLNFSQLTLGFVSGLGFFSCLIWLGLLNFKKQELVKKQQEAVKQEEKSKSWINDYDFSNLIPSYYYNQERKKYFPVIMKKKDDGTQETWLVKEYDPLDSKDEAIKISKLAIALAKRAN